MLTGKQQTAVELLLHMSDQQAASELQVSIRTLRKWQDNKEFACKLQDAENRQRRAMGRIARSAVIKAASILCSEMDLKTALEVLKLSKVLQEEEDSGESLSAILQSLDS